LLVQRWVPESATAAHNLLLLAKRRHAIIQADYAVASTCAFCRVFVSAVGSIICCVAFVSYALKMAAADSSPLFVLSHDVLRLLLSTAYLDLLSLRACRMVSREIRRFTPAVELSEKLLNGKQHAVSYSLSHGIPPAMTAGDAEEVTRLLNLGAPAWSRRGLNAKNGLHLACWNGHVECTKLLLERSVSLGPELVNSRDAYDSTALLYSAFKDNRPMVQLLLEHGAKPECADAEGLTPLLLSLAYRKAAVALCLLEHGGSSQLLKVDSMGDSPLHVVCTTSRNSLHRRAPPPGLHTEPSPEGYSRFGPGAAVASLWRASQFA
jgi:hypothetical protein